MLTLGLNPFVVGALIVFFIIICVLLMLTVLIQRPSGGGLSGAFGSGAGSGQTAFGAKTGDALTIATIIMFVLYLGLAVGLNYATKPSAAAPAAGTIENPAPAETPATDTGAGGEQPATTPPTGSEAQAPVPGTTEPGQTAPPQPGGTQPSEPPADQPPTTPAATPPTDPPAPVAPPR